MNHRTPLSITEKLILLATDEEKGATVSSVSIAFSHCVAGAILYEMSEKKLIEIKDGVVVRWPNGPVGNPVYDLALAKVKSPRKEKSIKHWIELFSGTADKMQHQILEGLVSKKILEKQDKVFLWVFHVDRYPEKNPVPENEIRRHLVSIIESHQEANEEDLILLGIVKASGLVPTVFGKSISKKADKTIDALVSGEQMSSEIKESLESIQTAIIAAVCAATIASSVVVTAS